MAKGKKAAGLGLGYFPGEDPKTRDPDDAGRWIGVYSDLLHFKEQVLTAAHAGIQAMTNSIARQAAVEADIPILEGENQRLRQRLDFWKRRHIELELHS